MTNEQLMKIIDAFALYLIANVSENKNQQQKTSAAKRLGDRICGEVLRYQNG